MTTPWADNLAKRTAESQDLFPTEDKPLQLPDRRPKPAPVKLGPVPTPTPQPIAPLEPEETPFMDRILKKAGATALDYIVSEIQQSPGKALRTPGDFSKAAIGVRNPLDFPSSIPVQAKNVLKNFNRWIDTAQEIIDTGLGAEISSAISEPFALENLKRLSSGTTSVGIGGRSLVTRTEPESLMEYLRSRPSAFQARLEQNREVQDASEEVFSILIRGGMNPLQAAEALEANFQRRPMSTQIGTSLADPFAIPGAIRGGIRGARILTREAPEIASNLRSLAKPQIAQAAGRDSISKVMASETVDEVWKTVGFLEEDELIDLYRSIGNMEPGSVPKVVVDAITDINLDEFEGAANENTMRGLLDQIRRIHQEPTVTPRVTPQVPALEGMTPLGLADEPPLVAPGGLQRGFESVSEAFTPEGQSKLFDVETAPSPAPLIDPAELSVQATERARLANEAAAGQQGLGLVDDVEVLPTELGETTDFGRSVEVRTEISRDIFEWRPATIERILNQGDVIEVRLPESDSTVRLRSTDVRRIQGDPAQTLIARITADKRPGGRLTRGIDERFDVYEAYERDLKSLTSEELQTVLEWTRTQDDWIRDFVGRNVDTEIRSRRPLDVVDEVPREEFASKYGITDPEEISTISRIGPRPLRIMEDGANQLEQIRIRDLELDEQIAIARGEDKALSGLGEAKNDLLREQKDVVKKMWDDLEGLGINRRTEGVQNLLNNLRKNIQEAAEDAEEATARERQVRQTLTPAAAPSPAAVPTPGAAPAASMEYRTFPDTEEPYFLSPEEFSDLLARTKTREAASDVEILGEDTLRAYNQAQNTLGSALADTKAIKAASKLVDDIEATLTPEQSKRFFATETTERPYEALADFQGAFDDLSEMSTPFLIGQVKRNLYQVDPDKLNAFVARQGKLTDEEQIAAIKVSHAVDILTQRNMTQDQIFRAAGESLAEEIEPQDAQFLLRKWLAIGAMKPGRLPSPDPGAVVGPRAVPGEVADEIKQAREQRAIDEASLSLVERAELHVEEAVAINTAIDSIQKIVRPGKGTGFSGFSREMLIEIAQQEGRDPTQPDWWDAMDKVLIRSFKKEHPPTGARGRARTGANAAERLAREQLVKAHIDTGKSSEAAVKAASKPKPSKKLKTTVKDPTVTSLLPDDLRRSKPQYRDQQIEFEDDLDKALYIVAASKPSQGEPKFLKWINDVTGLDTAQAKAQGKLIRAEIKKLYTGDKETPIFLKSTVTRPKIKPPTPAPIPTHPLLAIQDQITINGIESFLSDSRSIDGSRYEMFTPVDVEDTRAFIRVINEATGEIITENMIETIDEALTQWDQIIELAQTPTTGGIGTPSVSVADGAPISPPTEVGGAGAAPPVGPTLINAAGEPFDGDMVNRVLSWFKSFLADPARVEEWGLTLEWRREAQSGRAMNAREYENQLIAGGMERGEASLKSREMLSGPFPRPQTSMGLQEIAGPEVRAALYNRISYFFRQDGPNDEYWEMLGTQDALKSALQQNAIPDIPGPSGGSAKTRLQRVFGDEIVEGLDTPQDLETIIATRQERTVNRSAKIQGDLAPGESPPPRQERPVRRSATGQGALAPGKSLSSQEISYPIRDVPEETALSPLQPTLESGEIPGPRHSGIVDPRTELEKKFDLLKLGQMLVKKYSKFPDSEAIVSYPPGEIRPETWIQQWELMPDPDRHLLMSAAKLAGLTLIDFGNFLKANLASVDFSFWRQQQPLIFGNLDAFANANVEAFKAIWTQAYAEKVMREINSHPEMAFYDELEIDFLRPLLQEREIRMVGKFDPKVQGSDIDLPGVTSTVPSAPSRKRIVGGVEEFGLFGRERPIQRLTAALPWVKISGRAHITGTNAMNWKIFTTFMEQQRKVERGIAEGTILLKPGETFDIKREAKLFGTMLEDMSGRAQLPDALTKLTPAMNAGFFSMRLNIGRLIMGRHLFSKSSAVRKAAWKNIVTSVVGFSAIILGGKQLGLWDVETDSRSSDFMVIRIGKIRIDPWGGARQFVTFFARMIPIAASMETFNIPGAGRVPQAGLKSTTTGQITQGYGSNTMRLLRSKAAPVATLVMDTFDGKDFLGDPVDNTDIFEWAERVTPLAVQDIYEAFQEQGGWSATASAAAIVGAGVIVYDLPRWPDLDEYYMRKGTNLQSMRDQRLTYRRKYPLQEARLFVRGDVTTLSSPRARNLVLDIMSEHDVDPKDVKGYSKTFKDKPVPEGRSVSQEAKDRLKAKQDQVSGRSKFPHRLSISVQEELRRLAEIAAGNPVLSK